MATTYFYPKSFYDEMESFKSHPDALQNIAYFDFGLDEHVAYDKIQVLVTCALQLAKHVGDDTFQLAVAFGDVHDGNAFDSHLLCKFGYVPPDNVYDYKRVSTLMMSEGNLYISHEAVYTYYMLDGIKHYGRYTREQILDAPMNLRGVYRHSPDMFQPEMLQYKFPSSILQLLA